MTKAFHIIVKANRTMTKVDHIMAKGGHIMINARYDKFKPHQQMHITLSTLHNENSTHHIMTKLVILHVLCYTRTF